MSSSYLKSAGLRRSVVGALAVAFVLPAGAAVAAETYMQPGLNLSTEVYDNFDMEPKTNSDSDVWGYIAELETLIGIATPRSDTSILPRLRFQQYPDRPDRDALEGFLDLESQYRWERSEFNVLAKYDHQDAYNTLLPGAGFDDFDPLDPSTPTSARVRQAKETRDRLEFRPDYTFDVSERVRVGVEGSYENVDFNSDALVQTQVDYENTDLGGSVSWALNPRSNARLGAFGSRYEAKNGSSAADSYGADIGYGYSWSEVAGAGLSVFYEKSDSTSYVPVRTDESFSGWGGNFTAYWKGPASQWRLTTGRAYRPSDKGGRETSDQFRVQYKRKLTARLKFDGAGRYVRERALDSRSSSSDRDYARLDLSLRWMISPTLYLGGGYSYLWQEYMSVGGSTAASNRLFVSFGYSGLGRESR
ncbi:MAG: hypothetical protein WBM03_12415 [Steroidobacteraceae bacterium]